MAIPNALKNALKKNPTVSYWLQRAELAVHKTEPVANNRLRRISANEVAVWLNDGGAADDFEKACAAFDQHRGATHGGTARSDARAIYSLIHGLAPRQVVEIGTHNGVSAFYIAWALARRQAAAETPPTLDTVDIVDVNDPATGFWKQHNADLSPADRLHAAGISTPVQFNSRGSGEFFKNTDRQFDFFFIDGSHRAIHVYDDIVASLKHAADGAVILLHDYYAQGYRMSDDTFPIPGVLLAVQRAQREIKDLSVIPLNPLPWKNKYGTHTTSLAVLARRGGG
jgi:predicted O-methyltransferase YrrM